MPSRSAKLRQYVYCSKRYLVSCPSVIKAMADVDSLRTIEERVASLSLEPSKSRGTLFDDTAKAVYEKVNSDDNGLDPTVRLFLVAMMSPLIQPNSVDNSPTRQGATAAREPEPEHPQAQPVEFQDQALLNVATEIIRPIALSVIPEGIMNVVQQVAPIVSSSMKIADQGPSVSRKKRPLSTAPEQRYKQKTKLTHENVLMQLKNASPNLHLVEPVRDILSFSDLKNDSEFVQDFSPCDEHPIDESGKRMNYWHLHGDMCTLCSWVTRFTLPDLTHKSRVPEIVRKNMLILHVWGTLADKMDYCDVKDGMSSVQPPIFKGDLVDFTELGSYVTYNSEN